jgi:hypothetical protein
MVAAIGMEGLARPGGGHHMKSSFMRLPATIVLALVAVISAACSSSPPGTSPFAGKTPAQVLAMAKAAALGKGSMHWVEHTKVGSSILQFVTDAGMTHGSQVVTGSGGTATFLVVSPQMAYAKGDATSLATYLQVPRHEAMKYAGRWIAVPSSSPAYAGLALGLTLSSMLPGITPSAHLRFTQPATIDGKSVIGVSGSFDAPEAANGWAGKQVLYISTVAPYLPIELTQHGTLGNGQALTDASHMSDYGGPVVVTAPAHSIPISSIPGMS